MRQILVTDMIGAKQYLCNSADELQQTMARLLAEEVSHIVIFDEQRGKRWTITEEVLDELA